MKLLASDWLADTVARGEIGLDWIGLEYIIALQGPYIGLFIYTTRNAYIYI